MNRRVFLTGAITTPLAATPVLPAAAKRPPTDIAHALDMMVEAGMAERIRCFDGIVRYRFEQHRCFEQPVFSVDDAERDRADHQQRIYAWLAKRGA